MTTSDSSRNAINGPVCVGASWSIAVSFQIKLQTSVRFIVTASKAGGTGTS